MKSLSKVEAEVHALRGIVACVAEAEQPLPPRFSVARLDAPRVVITDRSSDLSVEVPLFAYADVRRTLATLFPEA